MREGKVTIEGSTLATLLHTVESQYGPIDRSRRLHAGWFFQLAFIHGGTPVSIYDRPGGGYIAVLRVAL